MIGVVSCERDELIAHGHDANGIARARGAADGLVETSGFACGGAGLFACSEEAGAEVVEGFGGVGGESVGGCGGIGGFGAGDPVECHLLPEGEVPELFVDGVRNVGELAVDEVVGEAFEDVSGWCGGTVTEDGLFEFGHEAPVCCVNWLESKLWMFDLAHG